MNRFQPTNFMLLPTMSCQGRCVYCFGPNKGSVMDERTADETVEFIYRIAPKDKNIYITFHGGEPLLAPVSWYRHILPQLRSRFGRRVKLSMQSNLLALSDEMLAIIEAYEIAVGTSVDGYAEMCEAQRGTGYFEKNTASRERLAARGISFGGICTFTPEFIARDSVEKVFRSFQEPFSLHGAVPGLSCLPAKHHLSAEEMKVLFLNSYDVYRAHLSENRISTIDSMAKGCFDGKGHTCTFFDCLGVFAAIASDGGVYSCQRFCGHTEYCFGSVQDLTEERILESPAYGRLRKQQDGTKEACGDCRHYAYCMGGCLYNALAAKAEKDPYCEAYSAVFDRLSMDMAMEMGHMLLGETADTPVLSMAGDQPHPYDTKRGQARLQEAIDCGKSGRYLSGRQSVLHPENHLNKLYLHLTFNCPLRCLHCYAEGGERKVPELSADAFFRIISEAANARFRSVVLTGGEPLVYPEFDRLLAMLNTLDRKGTKLILRSSFGFAISEVRLRQICAIFDEIVVSVDGDEKSHDLRRGKGRYAQTVFNLERAAALGYAQKLGLCATMEHTLCEGDEGNSVRELAKRLRIAKVRFRPILPLGRGAAAKQERYQLCAEEMQFEQFRPHFTCGLGQNLHVEPNGDTFPCYAWCEREKMLGNLGKSSLSQLLAKGELYEYCRHDVDTNEKCRTCEVRYLCGGICKAWVGDKHNVDSGAFDCTERRNYFLRLAESVHG